MAGIIILQYVINSDFLLDGSIEFFLIEFLAFVNGEGKAWELNVFKPLNHFKHACLYLNYDL